MRLFTCAGTKAKGDVIQVTWDNVEELEKYIESVKKAAEQLATENRQLRRWHYTICDKV
jgi:dynein heavy chain 2